jgi:hypothetical protein
MIDTDKYEGHAEGEWVIEMNDTGDEYAIHAQDYGTIAQTFYRDCDKLYIATTKLIADAPLLLAEVKRLRAYKEFADGVEEWSGGAAFIHHLATAVQGIRRTGELDEDAFNKGCQEYYNGEKSITQALIADGPFLLAEVERLSAEVRRLRDMVCLLEDSRITNMSILDRPELFADVAEVFRQRKEDTHGHLPNFGEE